MTQVWQRCRLGDKAKEELAKVTLEWIAQHGALGAGFDAHSVDALRSANVLTNSAENVQPAWLQGRRDARLSKIQAGAERWLPRGEGDVRPRRIAPVEGAHRVGLLGPLRRSGRHRSTSVRGSAAAAPYGTQIELRQRAHAPTRARLNRGALALLERITATAIATAEPPVGWFHVHCFHLLREAGLLTKSSSSLTPAKLARQAVFTAHRRRLAVARRGVVPAVTSPPQRATRAQRSERRGKNRAPPSTASADSCDECSEERGSDEDAIDDALSAADVEAQRAGSQRVEAAAALPRLVLRLQPHNSAGKRRRGDAPPSYGSFAMGVQTRSKRAAPRYGLRSADAPRRVAPPAADAHDLLSNIAPLHRQVSPEIVAGLHAHAVHTIFNEHFNPCVAPPFVLGVAALGNAIKPGFSRHGPRRKAADTTAVAPGACRGPPTGEWFCGTCSPLPAAGGSEDACVADAAAADPGPCDGCHHCQGVAWACAGCGKEVHYLAWYGSGSGKVSNGFDPERRRIVGFSKAESDAARAIEKKHGLTHGALNTVSQIVYQGSSCVPSCARRSRALLP